MTFYAIRVGRETGIYENWKECERHTKGYAGAKYKKFNTIEEAEMYLDIAPDCKLYSQPITRSSATTLIIYTDGSFIDGDNPSYSYGAVLIHPNGEELEMSERCNHPVFLPLRNVGGELLGVINSVYKAVTLGYKEIDLFYDYEGIEKWVLGEWKRKNDVTKEYASKMNILIKEYGINIHFHKVKAHSGDLYNERVDKLAKNAQFAK